MPEKQNFIRKRKILLGILALLFLAFFIGTQGVEQLLPINTAHATHVDPFECTAGDGTDTGPVDGITCAIGVIVNSLTSVFLSLALSVVAVFADAIPWFVLSIIVRGAFWLIFELVISISSIGILLSTQLIESAVYPGEPIAQGLLYNEDLLDAIRTALWIPVRDLVNAGFALLLVVGAILTIVKASKEVIAQYGPKFMIGIILVNFSWFIPRVVLDVANVSAAAAFSFARCQNCHIINSVDLSPFACNPTPPIVNCPTLLLQVNEISVDDAPPARKAMAGLLKPFQEILNLSVLPRSGDGWDRLSKLFVIHNSGTPNSNTDLIPPTNQQNPGYPSGWIGIGNIFDCIWSTCTFPPIDGRIVKLTFDTAENGRQSVNFGTSFNDSFSNLFSVTGRFLTTLALGTIRLIVLVFLAAIFLVLYVFALLAMMAMVLLRIPIIWLTMGFMPVVALGFVLGFQGFIGTATKKVWDTFVGAAFIPAALGIPVAAGSLVLNIASNIGTPIVATGIIADIFGPDGIIQIMFIIIAIIVIWLGVFAAISTINFAGAAQGAIASRIKTIGQGAAMATGYAIASKAPILPIGAVWKGTKLGAWVGTRTATATGKFAGRLGILTGKTGVGIGKLAGQAGAATGKGAWRLAKKIPGVESGTKSIGGLAAAGGRKVGQIGSAVGGAVGGAAAATGRKVGQIGSAVGGAVGGAAAATGRKVGQIGSAVGGVAGSILGPPAKWLGGAATTIGGAVMPKIKTAATKTREEIGKLFAPGLFQPTAAEKKMTGWLGSAQKLLGEKVLPSITGTAGSIREKIGGLFSGSALQKMLVGGAMKVGTGRLDSVLGDYARGGGQRSLGELINARMGLERIDKNSAKNAAEKLGKDPDGKGKKFLEAMQALFSDSADKDGRRKLLEVLEELKKDGITIDTSGGLGGIARAIIDEGQANTSNPLHSKFDKINGIDLELRMNAADKAAASGSSTTSPPPPLHPQ